MWFLFDSNHALNFGKDLTQGINVSLTSFGNLLLRYLGVVGRPMFAAAFGEHQEEVSLLRVSRAATPIRHASLSYESHVEI
jgi:hypothetical protein